MMSLRSKVTQAVLQYFFKNEFKRVYVNQLARELGLDPGNVDRKLREFEKENFLMSEFQGNQRYFFLNRTSPLVAAYQELIKQMDASIRLVS